jgi:ligand-binding SRPBCC domain-containing protein
LLNTLTPSWFDLEPQAHELQTLAPGVEITYRLRWRGIPLRWTSRIVDWEPPVRLTYEQVQGPYRWFRHEHLFEAEGTGTRVIDTVLYRAPGSRPIDRLLVRPDLKRIFRHREQAARLAFGAIQTRLPILEPYAADKPCTPQDGTA